MIFCLAGNSVWPRTRPPATKQPSNQATKQPSNQATRRIKVTTGALSQPHFEPAARALSAPSTATTAQPTWMADLDAPPSETQTSFHQPKSLGYGSKSLVAHPSANKSKALRAAARSVMTVIFIHDYSSGQFQIHSFTPLSRSQPSFPPTRESFCKFLNTGLRAWS